jgi:very-short-patch-repair endonuclease
VVARRQLAALGVTDTMTKRRVANGRLLRLHRGVYAVGHKQLRRQGHWLAAVLAVPGAVLSHRDAAGLHGLRPANHVGTDVTGLDARGRPPGIHVRRTTVLDADDVTTVDAVPVTTLARTLVDLAGVVPQDHLAKAVREADRLHLLDLRAIEAACARTSGRRGPGRAHLNEALAELAALATTLTRSSLEAAFLRLVARAGLPKPRTNVHIDGMEVDAFWPDHDLIVELDGWESHHTRHAFQNDRERDAYLTAAGYRVLRFTHGHVVHEADRVAALLRSLLAPSATHATMSDQCP